MPGDERLWWAIGVLILLLVIAVVLSSRAYRGDYTALTERVRLGRRPHRDAFRAESGRATVRRAAIVVNPTKIADLAQLRTIVDGQCLAAGWAEPLWLHTTAEAPGTAQARAALDAGVSLVCALGGDGTVRHVARGLVGSDTPMALLPAGTGNLLARNLDLPIDSVEASLQVALHGENKPIDVGWLRIGDDDSGATGDSEEHGAIFLVMAGLGFDATIIADTPERAKSSIGPAAYVVTGLRNLKGAQFKATVKVDGELGFTHRTRTVLIGNVGRLLGGLVLMPAARIDDGRLDAVLLSPKGVVGWSAVAVNVATRQRRGHPLIDHRAGQRISVTTETPQPVQLDGDLFGEATRISATVDPLALIVRVPQAT